MTESLISLHTVIAARRSHPLPKDRVEADFACKFDKGADRRRASCQLTVLVSSFKLAPGPGIFTTVPLVRSELTGVPAPRRWMIGRCCCQEPPFPSALCPSSKCMAGIGYLFSVKRFKLESGGEKASQGQFCWWIHQGSVSFVMLGSLCCEVPFGQSSPLGILLH